jgi:hypothetical protein
LRLKLVLGGLLAILPVALWICFAVDRSGAASAISWIGAPDFALFEDLLSKFLGPMPLPKLLAALLLLGWLLRSGWLAYRRPAADGPASPALAWLDCSGLQAGLVMTALVLGVSIWKQITYDRYFIVLLPSIVVWLSCQLASLEPRGRGSRLLLWILLGVWVVVFWTQSFLDLRPTADGLDAREDSNYRAVSLLAAPYELRYGLAPRHLTTSDRLLAVEGLLAGGRRPWRDPKALFDPGQVAPTSPFVMAGTGSPRALKRRFEPLVKRLKAGRFQCRDLAPDHPFVRVLECRPPRLPVRGA